MIYFINYTIKNQCHHCGKYHFRQYDLYQICRKCGPSPQQKSHHIDQKVQDEIGDCDKRDRNCHIFIKVDLGKTSRCKSCQHVEQAVYSEDGSEKDVNKETAHKTCKQSLLFSLHKCYGNRHHKEQIR